MGVSAEQSLKDNFIDYTYEYNAQRSFPDSRDGCKPVQRAILWEMYRSGYSSKKPHVKCAKIIGSVIGLWSPHGDVATYEALARMSQPFVNNIPEIDFHGANGNTALGQAAASQRYTEGRLSSAMEDGMFKGLNKRNVPFELNFSEDMEMPSVLPAIFPRLIVNGSQGIGSTVSQYWIPSNLQEVSSTMIKYFNTGEMDYSLCLFDFPTKGIIVNKDDLENIHKTGKGKVILRAKTEIKGNKILVYELPYQVYIEPVKDQIIDLVEKGKLSGIIDIINKTDKKGMLVEIEVERGFNPEDVLESLFIQTDLQKSYHANQMALVGKTPTLLTLKDYFDIYLKHNLECLQREAHYDLKKAEDRKEIVEGLVKAFEMIDDVINLIRTSKTDSKAEEDLIQNYNFTKRQAEAVIDMKLRKLAKLEGEKLYKELEELIATIKNINDFLSSPEMQKAKVISNLEEFTKKYGTPRKTQLMQLDLTPKKKEKVIVEETINVALTTKEELCRKPNGKKTSTIKDIVTLKTTEYLYLFSSSGYVYRILANDIPSNVLSIHEFLSLADGEEIISMSTIKTDQCVLGITRDGRVKKTIADEYINVSRKKTIAIKLKEEDQLVIMRSVSSGDILKINTNYGIIEINENAYMPKGKNTIGVNLNGKKDLIVKGLA